MAEPIRDPDSARRLARTIVSDIALYNKEELERGVVEDNLFDTLSQAIDEGRSHFEQKVDPELHREGYFEKALVDLLLKPCGRIKSRIW